MAPRVSGDLFDLDCQYLCHQCNCVTTRGKHLSAEVFRRYPYADIYSSRVDGHRDPPGTIILRGNPAVGHRYIVNLMGQYYPGSSRYANDTYQHREAWFQQCLLKITTLIPAGSSIGFP
jgi:hypothetical protein